MKWYRTNDCVSQHTYTKPINQSMCQRSLEAFCLILSNLNRIKPKPFVARLVFFCSRSFAFGAISTHRDIDNPPHINNTHTSLTSFRLFLICSHYVSVLFHNEIFHSKGYYGSAIFCIDNQVTREIFDGN